MKNDLLAMTKSQVEIFIRKTYKNERNRNVLRDRIINGLTYGEIIKIYYVSEDDMPERVQKCIIQRIQKMVIKLYKTVGKEK